MQFQKTKSDIESPHESHYGEKENPFYNNYVFSEKDLKRVKLRWWEHPFIWFLPTHTQAHIDGKFGDLSRNRYVYHYKVWGAKYFLIKIEEQKLSADKDNLEAFKLKWHGTPADAGAPA